MDRFLVDNVLSDDLGEVVALAMIVDAGEDEEKREETVAKLDAPKCSSSGTVAITHLISAAIAYHPGIDIEASL
ncbi:unnamed protein product [Clonostachys chloroleuca]|uniref:Uncharacterized protein n=1 Tax=Clonostachys chloroleuca TaxID=1926264 RepID=A0AA35MIW5_9HYPO|nr:unnamed protein product [Clonostachys chloroleuca]